MFSIFLVGVFFVVDIKIPLSCSVLQNGTYLYADRTYCIEGDHPFIGNSVVIQLPRHLLTPIYLHFTEKRRVIRLLSDVNNNNEFSDWTPDEIEIYAPGSNYTGNVNHLTKSVWKKLDQGEWKLQPGGPKFSSPILVEGTTDVEAYTVRFFNKIVGPPSRNKKKLFGAFTFVIIFNFFVYAFYT